MRWRHSPEARAELGRVVRFGLAGMFNVANSYVMFLLATWAGASPATALAFGTIVSVAVAYFISGRFVFASQEPGQAWRFLLAYLFTFAVNYGMLDRLIALGLTAAIAQLVCIPFIVALTYFVQRRFVFRMAAAVTAPHVAVRCDPADE